MRSHSNMTTVYMGVCMGNCYSHRKVLFTQESVIYTGKCNLHRKLVIYTGNWSFTQEIGHLHRKVLFSQEVSFTQESVIFTGKNRLHRKELFTMRSHSNMTTAGEEIVESTSLAVASSHRFKSATVLHSSLKPLRP
jgi:hypothetical protein